eukprot:m.73672 g.73672  ORF g.73672 m.73672 type:complete len:384 (-) comp12372_c0_seq2:1735-2886(-)
MEAIRRQPRQRRRSQAVRTVAQAASASGGVDSEPQPKRTTSGSDAATLGSRGDVLSGGEDGAWKPNLPLDMTLKNKIVVESPSSFQWCCHVRSAVEAKAMDAFITKQKSGSDVPDEQSVLYAFRQALYSYIYPTCVVVNGELVSTLERHFGSGAPSELLDEIQVEWKLAFESLYGSFVASLCNMFYLHCPELKILFRTELQVPKAYIASSTKGLRQLLSAEDIEFEECKGSDEMQQQRADKVPLIIEGVANMNALRDFILNRQYLNRAKRARNFPPFLISRTGFVHAQLKHASCRDAGEFRPLASAAVQTAGPLHEMVIEGLLMPDSVQRLCTELARRQPYFSMQMNGIRTTSTFNDMVSGDEGGVGLVDSAECRDGLWQTKF